MNTPQSTRSVQNRLLNMAIAVKNILEENDIPYFITYGTLLGAVRHKGFIPWDDDFDFYLFDDSYEQARDILREKLPQSLFLEDEESEPLYYHAWMHVKDLNSVASCELFPQDEHYSHKGVSIDLYRAYKMKLSDEATFRYQHYISYLERRKNVNLLSNDEYQLRTNKAKQEFTKRKKCNSSALNDPIIYTFPSSYNDFILPEELFPLKVYQFEGVDFYGPNNAHAFLSRCYGDYMILPPIEKRVPHYSTVLFTQK